MGKQVFVYGLIYLIENRDLVMLITFLGAFSIFSGVIAISNVTFNSFEFFSKIAVIFETLLGFVLLLISPVAKFFLKKK